MPTLIVPRLVTHTIKKSTNETSVTTNAVDTTGANRIVLAVTDDTLHAPSVGLTDSKGNTWTALTNPNPGAGSPYGLVQLLHCDNPIVGSGHTFSSTPGAPTSAPTIAMQAWAGLANGAVEIDKGAVGTVNGTSAPGSATPALNGELIVTACMYIDTTTLSVSGGFTISDQDFFVSNVAYGLGMAYLVQGAAAAANPSWTWPTSTQFGIAVMASFKPQVLPDLVMAPSRR